MNKKIKEQFKLLSNGKYKYIPKEKIMFNKSIESILEKENRKIKENKC